MNFKKRIVTLVTVFLFMFDTRKRITITTRPVEMTFINSCFGSKDFAESKEQSHFSAGVCVNSNKTNATEVDKSTKGELTIGFFFRKDVNNINNTRKNPGVFMTDLPENMSEIVSPSRIEKVPTNEFRMPEEPLNLPSKVQTPRNQHNSYIAELQQMQIQSPRSVNSRGSQNLGVKSYDVINAASRREGSNSSFNYQ